MNQAEPILRQSSQRVNAFLQSLRQGYSAAPKQLLEAIDYSLLAGGKRLRPTLVLEAARACLNEEPAQCAVIAAAAIELIHTFSLVHDDLPAMDDDDLRRGKPTNHKVFGEANAILAGDAMMAMAFEWLASIDDSVLAGRLIAELARASGPAGMIGGQVLDLQGENRSLTMAELQGVHRLKTGALLTSACRMGALCGQANAEQLNHLTQYGDSLGLAFQIIDDCLDVTSTPEQMGKATKKDAARGKNTYPALLGLDASLGEAQKQVDAALSALAGFGSSADGLRAIARFVIERKS